MLQPLAISDLVPVRFHHLKAVGRSPSHGRLALQGEEDEPTEAKDLGKALHRRVLLGEPPPPPVIWKGAQRRGKDFERFEADHPGARILTAKMAEREREEGSKVENMAKAIENHPVALELVTTGALEKTLYFNHLGRVCRGTPDAFTPERVVDLKTTRCAAPHEFLRDAKRRFYHAQLAWYLQAVALSGNGQPSDALIVAVESAPPWPVTVFRLTPNALDIGARQVRLWLERLLASEASDDWPGYSEAIVPFDVDDGESFIDTSALEGGSDGVDF